jgi:hypothetical protein
VIINFLSPAVGLAVVVVSFWINLSTGYTLAIIGGRFDTDTCQ